MKKSNLTGWKDVFSFTLIQTLKSKAYIISFLIILVLMLVSMPIISMVTSNSTKEEGTINQVKKVYVDNKTTLTNLEFSDGLKVETMDHIIFVPMKEEYSTVAKRIEDSETDSVILTIEEQEGMYELSFVKASEGTVKDNDMQKLSSAVGEAFSNIRMENLDISDEQLKLLYANVETKVTMTDVNGTEIVKEDTSITFSEYWFVYGTLFAIMMVNIMASTQIATSIVTEKSTKVIEYLLTSVKPLALMVGKIIAMLTATILQIISMIVCLFVSNKISTLLATGAKESVMSQYIPENIFQNLNIGNIVLCILVIILGMIFYAALAGLAGATVSRIEEMSEGLTLFTITNLVGVYVGIGAAGTLMGSGMNGFVKFAVLFPLSSPFILPGAILVGKVSLLIATASIVLQLLFIVLLFQFVAKVYETLILHNGNKIKVKELFKISKTV